MGILFCLLAIFGTLGNVAFAARPTAAPLTCVLTLRSDGERSHRFDDAPLSLIQQYLKAPAQTQAQLATMAHLWAAAHPEAPLSFPVVVELETIDRIELALSESARSVLPNSPLIGQAQQIYLALSRLKKESLPYDKYVLLALKVAAFFEAFQSESQNLKKQILKPNAPKAAPSTSPSMTEAERSLRRALEMAPDFLVIPTFGISLDRQARARLAQVPMVALAMDAPVGQLQKQLDDGIAHQSGTFGTDSLWLTQVKWPIFWNEFHNSFKSKSRRFEKQGVLILLNRLLQQSNHMLRMGSLGLRSILLQIELDPINPRPYENLARQIALGDLGDPNQLGKDPEEILRSAHKWLLDHVGDL